MAQSPAAEDQSESDGLQYSHRERETKAVIIWLSDEIIFIVHVTHLTTFQ
jgi:hypothetical protein